MDNRGSQNCGVALTRIQLRRTRHCERSAAISLGQGTLLRERDRYVAVLPAMTNRVRVSLAALLRRN